MTFCLTPANNCFVQQSSVASPRFGMCCLQGDVDLPLFRPLPNFLIQLLGGADARGKRFRTELRHYNNMFAFTSVKCGTTFRGLPPRGLTILSHRDLQNRKRNLRYFFPIEITSFTGVCRCRIVKTKVAKITRLSGGSREVVTSQIRYAAPI